MIKNDKWILEECKKGMIQPYETQLVKYNNGKRISYGLSSYGYDISLSDTEFWVFRNDNNTVVNPKNFIRTNLESVPLQKDEYGEFFVIPAHSYGLGVALEKITMPDNVTAVCVGKSTYARVGLIANITPVEAGWSGHLTLEFSNSSGADCRIYANEGIAQLLFFEGETCSTSYSQRQGKYQDQPEKVVFARV
jgi:dCTP deaminase